MRAVLLAFIPIVTGLLSAMWSRIVGESYILNALLWVVCGLAAIPALLAAGHRWPTSLVFSWPTMLIYIALNVALTWAWMIVTTSGERADPTPIALAEMSWPVFVVLFMWVLYGVYDLTKMQIVGGAVSLIGLTIIAFAK